MTLAPLVRLLNAQAVLNVHCYKVSLCVRV
jgi:hypothetical protein